MLSIGVAFRDFGIHYQAGTLGAIVRKQGSSSRYILGSNHVLYLNGGALLGRHPPLVMTPSPLLGPGRPIGVVREMPLVCRLEGGATKNPGDFGIAEIIECAGVPAARPCGMPALRARNPIAGNGAVGLRVWKAGAATGVTTGTIVDMGCEVSLYYPSMNARFRFSNQVRIASDTPGKPFSAGGDSGALVVTETGDPLALVCAQSGVDTVASPLAFLFDALGLVVVLPDESGLGSE